VPELAISDRPPRHHLTACDDALEIRSEQMSLKALSIVFDIGANISLNKIESQM
jgi:hypothetical protein